jgi:hypothetical protein
MSSTSIKFNCIEVIYNIIIDKETLYYDIRRLAQKGAKTSVIPSAYVIHTRGTTQALLIYDKAVEWRNKNKLDISPQVQAQIKKVSKNLIHSTIEAFKLLDPEMYPPEMDLIWTCWNQESQQSKEQESQQSKEQESQQSKEQESRQSKEQDKMCFLQCSECFRKVLSKNFNSDQKKCRECMERISKGKSAKEKYLELDPRGFIKESNELIDEFTMFDKRRKLTKEQFIDDIIDLKTQLNNALLMLHNVCKMTNISIAQNMEIKKPRYLYLIDFGSASKIIPIHFIFPQRDNMDLTNKRLLKFGLTDNLKDELQKYDSQLKYTYDKVTDKIKYIIHKDTDDIFGLIKEHSLMNTVKSMGVNYIMRDTTNILGYFDNKLVICDGKTIETITTIITYS